MGNKIITKIKQEIKARLPNSTITVEPYDSWGTLCEVIQQYPHLECVEIFYDDVTQPDEVTWYNIEGEGYGYEWLSFPEQPYLWTTLVYSYIVSLDGKDKTFDAKMKGRSLIFVKTDDILRIIIPLRDIEKRDILITCANHELDPSWI